MNSQNIEDFNNFKSELELLLKKYNFNMYSDWSSEHYDSGIETYIVIQNKKTSDKFYIENNI